MTTIDSDYLNFDNAIIGSYGYTKKNISTTCRSTSVTQKAPTTELKYNKDEIKIKCNDIEEKGGKQKKEKKGSNKMGHPNGNGKGNNKCRYYPDAVVFSYEDFKGYPGDY